MIRLTQCLQEEAARVAIEEQNAQQRQARLNDKMAQILALLPSKASACYDLGVFSIGSNGAVARGVVGGVRPIRLHLVTSEDGQSLGFGLSAGSIDWNSQRVPQQFEAILDYLLTDEGDIHPPSPPAPPVWPRP